MKKILIAALWALSMQIGAIALAKDFTWDNPPGSVGTRLYCGTAAGAYNATPVASVGTAVATATATFAGSYTASVTYFCAAMAIASFSTPACSLTGATNGCSPLSNEVSFTVAQIPLGPPTNLKVVASLTRNEDGTYSLVISSVDVKY